MNDRFKFRYVFEKDFGGKIGICYKMPVFNLDDAVRSVFENKIIEYTNFGYKLIAKNQCTGLKDKNGKLIYEGDIVKHSKSNQQYKVQWNDKGFWQLDDYAMARSSKFLEENYEIIGNIYEDKELLECQK